MAKYSTTTASWSRGTEYSIYLFINGGYYVHASTVNLIIVWNVVSLGYYYPFIRNKALEFLQAFVNCKSFSFLKVRFSSVAQLCPTLCDPMDGSTPGLPAHQLPELRLMSIESVMPSNHPILCRPLLLLPSIFPSIRVFSNESGKNFSPRLWG